MWSLYQMPSWLETLTTFDALNPPPQAFEVDSVSTHCIDQRLRHRGKQSGLTQATQLGSSKVAPDSKDQIRCMSAQSGSLAVTQSSSALSFADEKAQV